MIRQQPEVHDTFATEELALLRSKSGPEALRLRVRELSEHGVSLRNIVRKDKPLGRVICSDRAKVRHDRRLHTEK